MHSAYGRVSGGCVVIQEVTISVTNDQSKIILYKIAGISVAQCLSCCATNRKVTGSIPDGVIGTCH